MSAWFKPDFETLKSLLIEPGDLVEGELRFRVAGSDTLPRDAVVVVDPVLEPGARMRRVAAQFKMSDLGEDKVLRVRVPGAFVVAAQHGFTVSVRGAGAGVLDVGSENARGINAPQFAAFLKARPNERIFPAGVVPREGVYTVARDGNFYYGGERLRLWGIAMTARPNPEIAGRLRRIGFNSARLWGPDAGAFYEGNAATGLPREGTAGDGSRADQFHRLFAAMREEGIFFSFTSLMDSAPIHTEDDSWLRGEGAGDADWEAWREAWNTKDLNRVIRTFGASFDDRLMAARKRHITNILTFRNPYTGKTYGEEEAIAIFELNNEQTHVMRMLENGFDNWPEYFLAKYRARWNAWLRAKYGDAPGALVAAWGALLPGESAADGSVALQPTLARRGEFPAARAADFIQFNCGEVIGYYKELEAFARTHGACVAVAPFSYDTQYRPALHWLHTIAAGDVSNFGMYFWTLTSALSAPPAMYNMDSLTVKGKPTVIYETNVGRPNPFRAEAPLRIAAFASHQDWDAVYWHFYSGITGRPDVPDEQYLAAPVKYGRPGFYWSSVEFETDALLQSAISVAGRIFTGRLLPPAPSPALYTVARDSLYSYDNFHGINTTRAAFAQGAQFEFRPDLPGKTQITGADPAQLERRLTGAVASGEHIVWDWPNSRLIIDAPGVKAYIGKPAGNYRFGDGIAFDTKEGEFIALALASSDAAPLAATRAPAYLAALNDAQNTGFAIDNREVLRPGGIFTAPDQISGAIRNHGRAPVLYTPAPFEIHWPRKPDNIRATRYDFALRPNVRPEQTWLTLLDLKFTAQIVATPKTTLEVSFEEVQKSGSSEVQNAENLKSQISNLKSFNPLPGLCWADGYHQSHQILRDGPLIITSITPEDNSNRAAKTITLFNAELYPGSAADIEIAFADNKMTRITLAFSRPLPLTELLARLEKDFGAPTKKDIADAAYNTTTVAWGDAVELKEAQGVQTVIFNNRQSR